MRYECPEMHGLSERPEGAGYPCIRCGTPVSGRRLRWCSDECGRWFANNHWFNYAALEVKKAARRDDGYYICVGCSEVVGQVEVDHIERAWGAHNQKSCIHHQVNLRVLCIPCHRRRTREQASETSPTTAPSMPSTRR